MGTLLEAISRDLLVRPSDVEYLARSAPYRYKVYSVPKKQTGKYRVVAQPAREVKRLQYWVIDNVLKHYPIHRAAVAYRKGKSILDNASPHVKGKYLLKLDFEDFFHSITAGDLERFLGEASPQRFDGHDIWCLARILFWSKDRAGRLVLSIGAPTSPIVSNVLMYRFDRTVSQLCKAAHVVYTRYADDLSFSTNRPNTLRDLEKEIARICAELPYPRLRLNHEKTVHASMAGSRRVTGLVLSNEGAVSIGHSSKRQLRAALHHFKLGKLDKDQAASLAGTIAFVHSVEPAFVKRLGLRYGKGTINELLSQKRPESRREG